MSKTNYMIIKTAQNKQDFNGFALEMFNKKLAEVKSTTLLGIIVDSHLSWQQNCSKLCQSLQTPPSSTAAGQRRVEFQCSSL